jgi:competence protein ComEA
MEALSRYRGYIMLSLIFAIVFGGYVAYDRRPQPEPIEIAVPSPESLPTDIPAATASPAPITVHIAGEVLRSGVYALSAGSRLIDAVRAAGGLGPEADEGRCNLAQVLSDGQHIYIPRIGTPAPPDPTSLPVPAHVAADAGGDLSSSAARVNINTATSGELETLPGIGPTLAQRIIAYRREHGPFVDPADIVEVKGIGPSRYTELCDMICVE